MKEPTEWKMLKMSEKIEELKCEITQIHVKLMYIPEMRSQIENIHQEDYTKAINKLEYEKGLAVQIESVLNNLYHLVQRVQNLEERGFINWIKRNLVKKVN